MTFPPVLLGSFLQPAIAVIVERFLGYPLFLFRLIGHPVTWMGNLVSFLDLKLNTTTHVKTLSRMNGLLAIVLLCAAVWFVSSIVHLICLAIPYGFVVNALLATTLIAQKSLRDHVRDVARGLSSSLGEGRAAVSAIVGRDTRSLDSSDVSKAALESLAENTADGVVAPVFWYCLLGLPGLAVYKAINTADSMIGHTNEHYLHFGWAAAKLDDIVNWPAARLTALLFVAAAALKGKAPAAKAYRMARRDARKHRSPNAGWPEAAMAGALGVKLGGTRTYDGVILVLPTMGDGRDHLLRQDIDSGLKLYDRALWLLMLIVIAFALIPLALP